MPEKLLQDPWLAPDGPRQRITAGRECCTQARNLVIQNADAGIFSSWVDRSTFAGEKGSAWHLCRKLCCTHSLDASWRVFAAAVGTASGEVAYAISGLTSRLAHLHTL